MPATIPEPKLDTIYMPSTDEFEAQLEAIRAAQPVFFALLAGQIQQQCQRHLLHESDAVFRLGQGVQFFQLGLRSKLADTANQLFKEIEWQALLRFEEMGSEENPLIRAGGLLCSASVTEETVQNVDPNMWPALQEWLKENDLVYLLQKRLSSKAVNDWMAETGEIPPGVTLVQQKKLNIRKV